MRKSYIKTGIAILLLLALSGCSLTKKNPDYKGPSSSKSSQTGYKEPSGEEKKSNSSGNVQSVDDAQVDSLLSKQYGRYCFDTMDSSQRRLYGELLYIINNHLEEVKVSTKNSDDLKFVFQCIYNDHPEIFWVTGYTYTRHTSGDKILYLTFSGKYIYTKDECDSYKREIDLYVSRFLSGAPSLSSDYDKVKYVYEYIINNTDYVVNAKDNQTIVSVFVYGKSVCQGYAKATQYLLEKLGVKSTVVTGTVSTGEGHAWNLVNADGSYYYVDTTWGDSSYNIPIAYSSDVTPAVNYDFLNITTDEISKNHIFKNIVALPKCVATQDNYFIKENLYFTSVDNVRLKEAFNKAYNLKKKYITLKCSDAVVFSNMYEELITNQKIFKYLKNADDSIMYSISDEAMEFIFWL